MKKFIWLLLPFLIAAAPSKPNTYNSGDIISSDSVSENEDVIYRYLQAGVDTYEDGSIYNADIASGANIQNDKLNLQSIAGTVRFNTGGVFGIPKGTSAPSTCTVGDVFFNTGSTAGDNIYLCTATNTWTQVDAGGVGSTLTLEQIDTSYELHAIVSDNTGSGQLVFNNAPTMTSLTVGTALTITEGILTDSTIVSADIKDGEIANGDMAANSIDSAQYVDGSIDHEHLAADVITGMTDATPVAGDYVLIYDSDAAALRKSIMTDLLAGLTNNEIDTWSEFSAIMTDETGTGPVVLAYGANMTSLTVNTALTIAEGIITDSTIVSADIKANTITNDDITLTLDMGGATSFELPNGATPTVDAFGEIAGDNNLWAAGRGAPIFYDGTAAVGLVGTLVSDAPTNGQVPKWNTGGTITWEDDAGGTITGSDTQVLFFDGADNPAGDSGLVYNKTTNTLTADAFTTTPNTNPRTSFKDSDATDGDINGSIDVNCTDTGSGTEDCSMNLAVQVNGTLDTLLTVAPTGVVINANVALSIPYGAGTPVDASGEIAIDTTDDQFIYYGGAKRTLTYKHDKGLLVETVTTADTYLTVYVARDPITLTNVNCIVDPEDNANSDQVYFEFKECDSTAENCASMMVGGLTCTSTGASKTSFTNPTLDANDYMILTVNAVTGTASKVYWNWGYVIDAE